jgi:hypothetical protein
MAWRKEMKYQPAMWRIGEKYRLLAAENAQMKAAIRQSANQWREMSDIGYC